MKHGVKNNPGKNSHRSLNEFSFVSSLSRESTRVLVVVFFHTPSHPLYDPCFQGQKKPCRQQGQRLARSLLQAMDDGPTHDSRQEA